MVDKSIWLKDIGMTLSKSFSKYGYKIPTGDVPLCMLRVASLFDGEAKLMVKYWG